MKIISTQVLNGPNYWSNYRQKLIVMKLDIEKYEYLPTNLIDGFKDRLKKLLPSLSSHYCSLGVEGGFFLRIKEGTWLGHVIEHVALELQSLAGMDCGFGRTYTLDDEGIYYVIFAYEVEKAGLYAATAAVNIITHLAENKDYLSLEEDINELKHLFAAEKLGPSTQSIVDEAKRRKIPCVHVKDSSLILLGHGVHQKKVWATVSPHTSSIGVDMVADKELTKQILASNFIPVPRGVKLNSLDQLDDAIRDLGFPLVIKPQHGNHGRGVTTNIKDRERAVLGFKIAQKVSSDLIMEHFIQGKDYRFLVINFKVVAVAKRSPPRIVGTGKHTVQDLIDHINEDPKRGKAHEKELTHVVVDETTLTILAENNLTLDCILPEGQVLLLKEAANLSMGGTAEDVTDLVHPDNIMFAERIARVVNLDVCGIDIIAEDIKVPMNGETGAVIEVNAGPGFRMHLAPTEGVARNVAKPFIDMLYPEDALSKIPIIAVTGTNGKTTVVRLIAHFAKQAQYVAGFTTTEGIYIDNKLIHEGDCSGPLSAQAVLQDPSVEMAVLECARGGILRSGLGFDECNISVLTNISGDHLGLKDIYTMEELARVKAVVPLSTAPDGYAILNTDDELVYAIKKELTCNVALFGLQDNARIREHCQAGGLAAYIENGVVVISQGEIKHPLIMLTDIPLTLSGTATCMFQNILAAVLAGFVSHFALADMKKGLQSFFPSEHLPGRMNIFNFEQFKVMMDYAHNEGAFIELQKFMKTVNCNKKIGIIYATGDRREEDIHKVGYYAAQLFDEIIIRHDVDGRGRGNQELTDLLMHGMRLSEYNRPVEVISNGMEALKFAMQKATFGTFIFYGLEDVLNEVALMKREEELFRQANSLISHEGT